MSSAAAAIRSNRAFRIFDATIVKKAIVAVTGLVMFGFLVGHLAGNLQMFAGDEGKAIDAYAKFLKSVPEILWTARITLLGSIFLHIFFTIQLWKLKGDARPQGYVKKDNSHSTFTSKTMYYSGPMLFFFIVYHLLHFTMGIADRANYFDGEVFKTVVLGFQQPLISGCYVVAMFFLCLHLNHGLYSIWQTLGLTSPRYKPLQKNGAAAVSILMFLGFASIPAAVLAGVIHL